MDCRTCKHNSYIGIDVDRVSCCHPITLMKMPRWEPGNPAMVNFRTADVPVSQISELADCPKWESN